MAMIFLSSFVVMTLLDDILAGTFWTGADYYFNDHDVLLLNSGERQA